MPRNQGRYRRIRLRRSNHAGSPQPGRTRPRRERRAAAPFAPLSGRVPRLRLDPATLSLVTLSLMIVSCGLQAIVTQSLLLREALVLMFGSEFAWGVVLSAWLLGVAVGAVAGGRWSQRTTRPDVGLVIVLLLLSAATCVELWVFRGARAWLGVPVGEFLPLSKTALAAVLFVSPASALVGVAFPLACCVTVHGGWGPVSGHDADLHERPRLGTHGLLSLGQVYALESAGSLLGGAAFSFWAVEHWSPIQIALACGVVTSAIAAALLAVPKRATVRGSPILSPGEGARPIRGCPILSPGKGGGRIHDPDSFRRTVHRAPFAEAKNGAPARGTFNRLRAIRSRLSSVTLLGVSMVALVTATVYGPALHRALVQRRWHRIAPGYELCAETESRLQNLAIGRRETQYTLYSDGQVTADFPDPYTFVPLAHFWMCQHPAPRRVLLLGGGAEGLLSEILLHPVERVDYVEPDPKVINLLGPFLREEDRRALSDPRVTVHFDDARFFLKGSRDRFDLVMARLPEPFVLLHARLYTMEFFRELRQAMTNRSVLCLTAAATPGELTGESAEYLASIRATLKTQFPQITVTWGNPAHILAATAPDLVSIDPAVLAARYTARDITSALFDAAWFEGATDWLDPQKLGKRAAELDAARGVALNTDLHPILYLQRLALWEKMTAGSTGRIIGRLRSIRLWQLISLLLIAASGTLCAYGLRERARRNQVCVQPARPEPLGSASRLPDGEALPGHAAGHWFTQGVITLSVASTGLTTMALSMIWLFAFQNLYGYVYQRIGWIIALFMAGLVAGCGWITWKAARDEPHGAAPGRPWRRLIGVDLGLVVLACCVPSLLSALGSLRAGPFTFAVTEWCISAMVFLTGLLGGAAFALAGGLQLRATGRSAAAAGSVVGADHAGACLGAFLSGIVLVPVFGTVAAAFLLGGIKLSSVALLILGWRRCRAG